MHSSTTQMYQVRKAPPPAARREAMLEQKAWFLCKFLSRELDEDTYEKIRYHISICKGVKTRVKLSSRGWSAGYKTNSFRSFSHKLPYEFFPLDFIEGLQQDSMFVNVLLCMFRMQNLPDIQFEIVAYKFKDSASVRRFQDIFHSLTGVEPLQTIPAPSVIRAPSVVRAPASSVRGYQQTGGAMSPDRWGSPDRYPTTDSVLTETRMNEPYRREQSSRRMILDSEGSWSAGSSLLDEQGPLFRTRDGTMVTPSPGSTSGRGRNNITLTGLDSYDGPGASRRQDFVDTDNHKIYRAPPSDRNRTAERPIQRNRYQSTGTYQSSGYQSAGYQSAGYQSGYQSGYQTGDSGSYYGRSRSMDTYGTRGVDVGGRYGSTTPRNGYIADNKSDVVSVKSQTSYLLAPNFKKVYSARSGQLQNGYGTYGGGGGGTYGGGSVQGVRPRAYAGSEIRQRY